MKRKRRWIKEYRCDFFKMNILERLVFCKQACQDKKCVGCPHRGNEDGLNRENQKE